MARRRSRRAQADYGHFSVTVSASSAYGQRKGAAAKTARGDAAARSRGRLGVCRGGSAASKFPGTGLNIADRTLPNPGIMKSAIVVPQPWFLGAEFSLRGCNLLQTSI